MFWTTGDRPLADLLRVVQASCALSSLNFQICLGYMLSTPGQLLFTPGLWPSAALQMQISHLCCVCLCPVVPSITALFPYSSRLVPHHIAVSARVGSCVSLLVSSPLSPHCLTCFSVAFGVFNEWMFTFLKKQTK